MKTTQNTAPAWTPGPWRVSDGAILSDKLNDYGNFIVADCRRELTAQDKASLALIAAAPEMAQTIQDALDWTEGDIEAHRANGESERDLAFLEARASQLGALLARINGEGGGK